MRRPSFSELVALRALWREAHQKQDRDCADAIYTDAGIARIDESELAALPEDFRRKLGDFGRDWERAIAARAIEEKYAIHRARLRMTIDESRELPARIEARLAEPSGDGESLLGAALFFESNGRGAIENGVWDCLFYFVLHSGKEPGSLPLADLPGLIAPPEFFRIA